MWRTITAVFAELRPVRLSKEEAYEKQSEHDERDPKGTMHPQRPSRSDAFNGLDTLWISDDVEPHREKKERHA